MLGKRVITIQVGRYTIARYYLEGKDRRKRKMMKG